MCFGGSSSSTSTSQAANNTTVNVTPTTNIDTADLANAIDALAGAQGANQLVATAGTVQAAQYDALGRVAAAQVASGPSLSTMIMVAATILGVAFAAGIIKLPHGLRA